MSKTNTINHSQGAPQITFAVGGNVFAKRGFYVSRKTDAELLAHCREGNFAYVLAPRQLGKTSLVIRTSRQLQEENILSVIVDLSPIGNKTTVEQQWYLSLLGDIIDQLDLDVDLDAWWAQHSSRGASKTLILFFREVLLRQIQQPVVIFLDEIDSTINLEFKDDFFAALRYIYNARGVVPGFQRISFVLIGVATPHNLISDPYRTPFNVGYRVDLNDFTLEEAAPLVDGLGLPLDEARRVLSWIFKWTLGHPYLTMRVCRFIADSERRDWSEQDIDNLVAEIFFGKIDKDLNLQFVRDMLTVRVPPELPLAELLTTFKSIRRRQARDDKRSLVLSHLKLSGVLREDGDNVRVRNPIYREVFDDKWIKDHLPETWAKQQYQRARRVAILAIALLLLFAMLLIYALRQRSVALDQRSVAEEQRREAVLQRERAERARADAQRAAIIAEERRAEAETLRAEAEEARKVAVQRQDDAERERSLAEAQRRKAQDALRREETAKEMAGLYREGVDLYLNSEFTEAAQKLDAALKRYQNSPSSDIRAQAMTMRIIGGISNSNQETEQSLQYYQQALAAFRQTHDISSQAATLMRIGDVYKQTRDKTKAIKAFEEALGVYKREGNKSGEGRAYRAIGETLHPSWDKDRPYGTELPKEWPEAFKNYRAALEAYQAAGDKPAETDVLTALTYIYRDADDKKEEFNYQSKLLSLYRERKLAYSEASTLIRLISLSEELGNTPQFLEFSSQLLQIPQGKNMLPWDYIVPTLVTNYPKMNAQQKPLAINYLEEMSRGFQQSKELANEARVLRAIGHIYANSNDLPKAVEYYDRALKVYRAAKDKIGEGDVLKDLGRGYYYSGNRQKGFDYYKQALKAFQAGKADSGEFRMLRVLGEAYYISGDKKDALEVFEEFLKKTLAKGSSSNQDESTLVQVSTDLYAELQSSHKAEEFFSSMLKQYEQRKDKTTIKGTLVRAAIANLVAGRREKALEHAGQLLDVIRADNKAPSTEIGLVALVYFFAGEKPEAVKLLNESYKRAVLASKNSYYVGASNRSSSSNILEIATFFDIIGERNRASELYLEAYSSYDDTSSSTATGP